MTGEPERSEDLLPALFLHTQKTAGTSVQEMARWAYGNRNVVSHADYVKLGIEGCRPFPFVSGHFGIEFARPLMAGRYCFTFVRRPVDRIVSLFAFCQTRPKDENELYAGAQQGGLSHFLSLSRREPFRSTLRNHQVWQLAYGWGAEMAGLPAKSIDDFRPRDLLDRAIANLDCFDFVGTVETFSQDVSQIFHALGRPGQKVLASNVTDAAQRPKLSPWLAFHVSHINQLDQKLYNYVIQKRK